MRGGRRLAPSPALADVRARARQQLACLPEPLARLQPGATVEAQIAPALQALTREVDRRLAAAMAPEASP
ncbi:MAG TPA: nicotinate phosphoribosyltransferase, partial [Caulobacteraceae bacterium]|nr:nicotinate phosphoribosyltransferase [Caulobacteraceae bacterium]